MEFSVLTGARRWFVAFALVTSSMFGTFAGAACTGDCNGDDQVDPGEILQGIDIALERALLELCPNASSDADGHVTVDELIDAVSLRFRENCGVAPTPTSIAPTPTATPTPPPDAIPTSARALTAWLKAGAYLSWHAESAPHSSGGPHGGTVRTFLNDAVFASLQAGNAEHPAGSALVKELYFGGITVKNWAVEVKLQDDSNGGQGWYWYEGEGLSGVGLQICTGCHGGDFNGYVSKDFVLSTFPLQ